MDDKGLIEDMNRYYRVRAPMHDQFMRYQDNEQMEALLSPIISGLDPVMRDRHVLEVACGTGNWTQVLSKRARSVTATDINEECLRLAQAKGYERDNVVFRVADAYTMDGVEGRFDLGFAADWWSHIPLSSIPMFLRALNGKLEPGSKVIILDMLPTDELDAMFSHFDGDGNLIHKRDMPDGRTYRVVKNFPNKDELLTSLARSVDDVGYREYHGLRRWVLTYTTR